MGQTCTRSTSRLKQHSSCISAAILVSDGFLNIGAIDVGSLAVGDELALRVELIKYITKAKQMGWLVNAYLDVHLEGEEVEVKVIYVPVHNAPIRLIVSHWVCAWVGECSYPICTVICSLNKYPIICIGSGIVNDILRNGKGKALDKGPIDSSSDIETEGRLIVNLYCFLPKKLQDIHHRHYILPHRSRRVDLRRIVHVEEPDGPIGQALQKTSGSLRVIDWNQLSIFDDLIVNASCMSVGSDDEAQKYEYWVHLNRIGWIIL